MRHELVVHAVRKAATTTTFIATGERWKGYIETPCGYVVATSQQTRTVFSFIRAAGTGAGPALPSRRYTMLVELAGPISPRALALRANKFAAGVVAGRAHPSH
jgi:hypothetical protein